MDGATIAALISVGLTVAAAVFGAKYRQVKALLKMIVEAFEDDAVSPEEFQAIVAQAKALTGKSEG